MPGRQSHGGAPSKVPKIRVNNKKRSLNAFAIAEQAHPEKIRIRQHRLGTSEGGNRPGKRSRNDKDGSDEEVEGVVNKKARNGPVKGRFDELDVDAGSDSEGNEWRLGQVDSDDDSDLDSDEAFGESDEERFEGFAFSGGSTKTKAPERRNNIGDLTLDEGDSDENPESDYDSLEEHGIDIADALDSSEDEEDVETKPKNNGMHPGSALSDGESSGESEESDEDDSSLSSMEDIDEKDELQKIGALQDLIASLPQADQLSQAPRVQRDDGASEYATPSEYGITIKKKLTLEDLSIPAVKDPHVKKSIKLLATELQAGSKSKKLAVPLSKREENRLERSAAYETTKETLSRWTDTVKRNREAENLTFPLPDPDFASTNNNTNLQSTANSKPYTDLEATIQNILEESGLAAGDDKDNENRLIEFEELEMNKMSIEEVRARRDELRKARDLMFREEARSKRIKKIKSKSYRKVHRKQREKEDRINKEALLEAGVGQSEDQQEAQDRRRAEERMGARHRGSRWAKEIKGAGRAAWDEDARTGVTEMARRDEELRMRVEGRVPSREGAEEIDSSSSEDDDSEGTEDERNRLEQQLDVVSGAPSFATEAGSGSKLANMKFMLKADASRRLENDAAVRQMRRDLAGEESSDEEIFERDIGRRSFGPNSGQVRADSKPESRDEFEEPEDSHDEDQDTVKNFKSTENIPSAISKPLVKEKLSRRQMVSFSSTTAAKGASSSGGAWSSAPARNDPSERSEAKRQNKAMADVEELDLSKVVTIVSRLAKTSSKPIKKNTTKATTLEVEVSSDEETNYETARLPFAIRDQELIKRAFAGADVVGEFNTEKRQTVKDDEEKVIDNTLPGWGSWTGDGLSKKERKKIKDRVLTTVPGISPKDRKDSKLERVIINEKQVKKNGKYLASTLPHPFETRQQYERSLRLPMGPEWTTKETFQTATKPRILLKQGIIAPMRKPLV